MESITKAQLNTALDIYAYSLELYSASVSEFSATGTSKAKVNFDEIYSSIEQNTSVAESSFVDLTESESLSTQMLEMAKVYEKFQSVVEIKNRIGSIYKLSVTGQA